MTGPDDAGMHRFEVDLSALQHDLDQHQSAVRELRTLAEARLAEIEAMAARLVQVEAARDAAQLEERRRIVAYLRALREPTLPSGTGWLEAAALADRIERGEHAR